VSARAARRELEFNTSVRDGFRKNKYLKENAMRQRMIPVSIVLVVSLLLCPGILSAANATIEGLVKDYQTGEPLPGANVTLAGTGFGASTTVDGKYAIRNVPPGSYTIRAAYIGYKSVDIVIQVREGTDVRQDFKLRAVSLEGETVVVTAQAEGQNAAINQQLAAAQIMNVVSAARIQELPDANAAESMGRLPGVSISRYGGEGTQVTIRGLAPKYNIINVDGVRMASSNADDRSTDLSMISPNMLEGIEVSKTITADQDADVLGGTVNFKTREARGGREGLGVELLAQGGYNGLSDAYNKYNNYKYVGSIEGRFFEERLGVFAQANVERRNLTSNELNASYSPDRTTNDKYLTETITLNDVPRQRERINGTLSIDYKLPEGKISLTNLVSSGKTQEQNRQEGITVGGSLTTGNNRRTYSLIFAEGTTNMIANTLKIEHQLPLVHMEATLSHAYSETKNPNDWSVNFLATDAGINDLWHAQNLDPRDVVRASTVNPAKAELNSVTNNNSFGKERALMGAADFDFPVNFSDEITSVFKFGGKYRYQTRSYTNEQYGTNYTFTSPSAKAADILIGNHFGFTGLADPTQMPMTLFLDPHFSYGTFLGGDYTMANPLSFSMMQEMISFLKAHTADIRAAGGQEGWARNNYASITRNYSGNEALSAFYTMATIKVGSDVTVIPGVRYQNLKTTYSGTRGQSTAQSYDNYNHDTDTSMTKEHPFWLPNVNVKFMPLTWLDIRFAYSQTLSYPDYSMIIPRIDAPSNPSQTSPILWNNYDLKPSRSKNYDISMTFSDNTIGLFSVGAFQKNIEDLIYPWTFSKVGLDAQPYYLSNKIPNPNLTYFFSSYRNNPFVVKASGMEFDWQTHFWYLPDPFKGLILNANYTHVSSKAQYPYHLSLSNPINPRLPALQIDTSYIDRLISQPNQIVNLSVGYDYMGFSIRVSMLYQADIFTIPNQYAQDRASTSAYRRWDISFKQKLPVEGLQLYGSVNNLNGAKDQSVLQMYSDIPTSLQEYGMTADLGLRWQW